MTGLHAAPAPDPTTTAPPLVPQDPASVSSWWDWVLGVPLQIAVIVVASALVLALLRTAIRRVTEHIADGTPVIQRGVLRPLGESAVASTLLRTDPLATARRKQRARTLGSVLRSSATVLVGGIAAFLVLDALGVNIAPFIASAGIVGVALGFGAQSLVKDFLTGTFMMLEDQYGVGDVVDVGPATGTVEAVTLRVTKVRDGDGTLWYVPNGSMLRVGNKTQGWSTAVVELDVDYFADLDHVQRLLLRAAEQVGADPELADAILGSPTVTGIERLTAEAITLRLQLRTAPAVQWEVARALRIAARRTLEEAGVPLAGQRDALTAHLEAREQADPAGPVTAEESDEPADGAGHDGAPPADPHDTPVDEALRAPRQDPPAAGPSAGRAG